FPTPRIRRLPSGRSLSITRPPSSPTRPPSPRRRTTRDAARIVTKLELAAWGLVIVLLGAEGGLAVVRPWDHHVALSLSGSQTSSLIPANGSPTPGATKLVTPSAGAKCLDVVVSRVEQLHTIPRSAWLHASAGVTV